MVYMPLSSFSHGMHVSHMGQVGTVLSSFLYEILFWQLAYQQHVHAHILGPRHCSKDTLSNMTHLGLLE